MLPCPKENRLTTQSVGAVPQPEWCATIYFFRDWINLIFNTTLKIGWFLNTQNCQCIGVCLKGRATWPLPPVFKMLLLQLFHRAPDHTQWDGCQSALCRSALSNSHNAIFLEHSSYSCFLLPLEEVKDSAARR